ncbi:uncharacterized protein GJ701_007790 isoform 1-T2 [Geothlypis trichas]
MEPAGTRLLSLLSAARCPSLHVELEARGGGSFRKLTPSGSTGTTQERPAKHGMNLGARLKGPTGRLPQEQRPPVGRRGTPVPLGHRSALSSQRHTTALPYPNRDGEVSKISSFYPTAPESTLAGKAAQLSQSLKLTKAVLR